MLRVLTKKGRVEVEGLAYTLKRHTKPSTAAPQGGIIDKPMPIDRSNLALWCPDCGKGVRTGTRWVGDAGTNYRTPQEALASFGDEAPAGGLMKVRACRSCGRGV